MSVVLWLLLAWGPAEAVVDVEGPVSQEARGRSVGGVVRDEELAKIRAVLEAYVAHRRSLNHFRCRYRVYWMWVTRSEAEAFGREGKLPPEDRWQLEAECLWICQPDSILAVTRLVPPRTARLEVRTEKRKGQIEGEGTPGGWLIQSVSGGNYVAMAMGTRGAIISTRGDPAVGPVESLLGPAPHAPPTSMALMGMREENNPIIKHMLPNLRTHPEWFRWLGPRQVLGMRTVGVEYAPVPEEQRSGEDAVRERLRDRYWLATDAGYLPVLDEYTHSNGRAVARMLDVRRVAEGRWFPYLAGRASWNPRRPSDKATITVIRVDEFEWGYEASDEEMAMRLDRDAQLEVEIDGELRWYPYGRGKLSGRELPELVKAMEEGRWPTLADVLAERAAPKRQAWLIVAGGLALVIVLALMTRYLIRRGAA